MSSEGKFWATQMALAYACAVMLSLAFSSYQESRDKRITEMVVDGADPIYAACSLGGMREETCRQYFALDSGRSNLRKQ